MSSRRKKQKQAENLVRLEAQKAGLALRVNHLYGNATHWMFDLRGRRVLDYWPSTGTCWAAELGRQKVASDREALAVAQRLAADADPARRGPAGKRREGRLDPVSERNLQRQLADDGPYEPAPLPPEVQPTSRARLVCGVSLTEWEATWFDEALGKGTLVVEACMPVHSGVYEAWRRYCEQEGMPHRTEESQQLQQWRTYGRGHAQ